MSRIGKKPITIPAGITVTTEQQLVRVSGPKGTQDVQLLSGIAFSQADARLQVQATGKGVDTARIGLMRSLVQNAITGVSTGWSKTLELVGVGYRAQTDGKELTLNVGFAHPVKIPAPQGVTFAVAENKITVSGADKYLIGETAAKVRRVKKPEPYKGKGIRYVGEYIRKKAGKAAKTTGRAGTK